MESAEPVQENDTMKRRITVVGGAIMGAALLVFGAGCSEADIVFSSLDLAAAIVNAAT